MEKTNQEKNRLAAGNYIAGKFTSVTDPSGEWVSKSPADWSDELGVFRYSYRSVDDAVAAARDAFRSWRKLAESERFQLIRKYQEILRRRSEELSEVLAREVGKPLWEAKGEVQAMINKVDITLKESMECVAEKKFAKIMDQTAGRWSYKPLGVCAVIGPFNFPGHLPNGHIIPALATGNTVVFKPSEKSPRVGELMAECFDEAGFPAGVFNLVQGEKEVGRRLCIHEGVDAVLFTGSYEVGTRIKQDTLQQHWKLLALEMGGKNPVIIWEDADLDHAIQETLAGAYLSAGQRCSATSRVIIHRSLVSEFVDRFHQRAKNFKIGHPFDQPFMGPLIDSASVDRYMKFIGIASREGAEVVMRGKALELDRKGTYVTPSICWFQESSLEQTKKSVYQQAELFAPNVAILGVSDLDDAIAQANATQFGLVCSVFSQSRSVYEKCYDDLQMGLVNWNRATVGASSKLPFGGLKKSGNHFPTAVTATLYCTYPVAALEVEEPKLNPAVYPGINWN